ncbi:MAG: hypothetical protein CVU88_04685 [Firmicutes bacterium HGW-Firmicutes-13]|nr:MAG: hypothetical protein CVU88_04685 [Firmicutes bacterium HGW-Firmicutes-13]
MDNDKKYNLYAIDANICLQNDKLIIDKQCSDCEHYKGFEIYHGQRCIKCSAYYDFKNDKWRG